MLLTQLPLFAPASDWRPRPLPEWLLSTNETVALDTETNDPDLKERGPGFALGVGYVAGISIATATDQWYFPIKHLEGNVDRDSVIGFIKRLLSNKQRLLLLANASYDLGWLRRLGIHCQCKLWDIQIAESLLEEEHPEGNSLEALSRRYSIQGKDESLLKEATRAYFGNVNPKSHIAKLPARFVGPYAEADARATFDVYAKQCRRIAEEELQKVAELEMRLIPHVLQMTLNGIRINVRKAELLDRIWEQEEQAILKTLGMNIEDVWSTETLATAFMRHGIKVLTTDKGNPSVTKDWLSHQDTDFAAVIRRVRELNRLRKTYIRDNLLGFVKDGRIHPHFLQLKRREDDDDEKNEGTVARFASKKPNEQQIPKRSSILVDPVTFRLTADKERGIRIGKVIRSLRLPEQGCKWAKLDYSSQEPRWQAHYAILCKLPGTREVVELFARGEKLYTLVEKTGRTYDEAKQGLLAKTYGMQPKTYALKFGVSLEEAESVLGDVDEACPYLSILAAQAAEVAKQRGYVRTHLGRRGHFYWFTSRKHWSYIRDLNEERQKRVRDTDRIHELEELTTPTYGRDAALKKWPEGVSINEPHKAFSRIIQGSSADQTKAAFLEIAETIAVPISTVHDEINNNVADEATANRCKKIMEGVFTTKLPFVADLDLGDHWQ